ncbi:MAG: Ig-like domain-containing protein, partial [Fidelibacterota bacterium]
MKATLQAVLLFIVLVAFWACEEEPQIARVSLSPPSAVIHKGETLQFTARVSDDNGDVVTNAHVIWSSDDEAVATIDDDGLATGVSQGSATITATADGAWGSASLTVELTAEQWLAGSWISTDREQKLILTTRSDQDGFDLFSEGDGAIDVTGGQTAELTFLFGLSEEESGGFFIATSSSLSRWFQEGGAPPHPALILEDDPPARPAM